MDIDPLYDWLAFIAVAAIALAAAALLPPRTWPLWFRQLIVLGVAARIAGSIARLYMVLDLYRTGDALRYYAQGSVYAGWLHRGELARALDAASAHGALSGTGFVEVVAGLVLALTGPSLRASCLVFSLCSYAGLLLFALACLRAGADAPRGHPGEPTPAAPALAAPRLLAASLLLWPSLCFWPGSMGKEALILLGLGWLVYGFAPRGERGPRWLALASGVLLVSLVRPHVGLLTVLALLVASWAGRGSPFSARRLAHGIAIAGLVTLAALQSLDRLGLGDAGYEEVTAFVEQRSKNTEVGGSKTTPVSGVAAIPMAVVNVVCRPFPWEARTPMTALSALEVALLWLLLARRRREVLAALRGWRRQRLLTLAVPLCAVLIAFYGGFIANLGILARQRIVILPLLFLFSAVRPAAIRPDGAPSAPAASLRSRRAAPWPPARPWRAHAGPAGATRA